MPRLFVALPVPDEIAGELCLIQGGVPDAHWVAEENFHVTLAFLGEVDGAAMADAVEALATVEGPVLDLEIAGVDHFVEGNQPTALYATVVASPELVRLQERVRAVLRGEGLRVERRKFRPHVTLARFARRAEFGHHLAQFVASHNLLRLGPAEVESFGLYSSRTRDDGAVYTLEAEFPLGY